MLRDATSGVPSLPGLPGPQASSDSAYLASAGSHGQQLLQPQLPPQQPQSYPADPPFQALADPSLGQSLTLLPQIDQDDILQKHCVRVQHTLLDSVDKRVAEIEQHLRDNQALLKRTQDDKITAGEALYQAKTEVGKLNAALATTRYALQNAESEQKAVAMLQAMTESDIQEVLKVNKMLQRDVEALRRQHEEALAKMKQMQEINTNYTSDLKIQKRIQNKLKKELEVSELKRKQAEEAVEAEKQKYEMAANKRHELEIHLEKINELTSIKEATEKQWSEAITAMSKRDKSFQIVEDAKEKLLSQFLEARNSIRVLTLERDETLKKLTEKELECEGAQRTLSDLRLLHKSTLEKFGEVRNGLQQAETAESLYKQEVEKLKRTEELKSADVEKKAMAISSLKAKITQLKSDFDEKMRLHVPVEHAVHREEIVKQQAAAEVKAVTREEETKNIKLRRQNAQLQMKVNETAEKVLHVTQERDMIQEQYQEISAHYSKLYEEAKHLIYALERREHDLNFLRAKMSQKEADNTGTFNLLMGKLRKDLADSADEKDRLQQLWLESQKDALKAKERVSQLEQENAFLQTKIGINDAVKTKTNSELAESKNEAFEQKLEAAKLYNELRRIQPVLDDLRQKNKTLEQQLHEARLKLEEAHVNNTTSTQMLRTEIRRLYQDRSELKHIRSENEQASAKIERKTELFREMVDKLKSERYELQRANYALKRKAEEMERKYFDAKLQARRMTDKQRIENARATIGGHSIASIQAQAESGQLGDSAAGKSLNSQAWASLLSLSNGSMVESMQAPAGTAIVSHADSTAPGSAKTGSDASQQQQGRREIRDVPDFEAWRLKIDSLVKEKDYLMIENKKLQEHIDEQGERLTKVERQLFEERMKQRATERKHGELEEQVKALTKKYQRAEKIASHMEQQIKEAKPNFKIDYQMLGDAEPSTQLLAALLSSEAAAVAAGPGAGPGGRPRLQRLGSKMEEPGQQQPLPGMASRRVSGLRM
ncbi:hypothetical protein HK105_206792 [Polyrhizophydium stewartii]|uniref:Uncharacterized protein n=1 Tax=Polyrhizophydium stewartii TaxID=2732419 RepID=A0ABR4N267_9FUNG